MIKTPIVIDKTSGCWLWNGHTTRAYPRHRGKQIGKTFWEIKNGRKMKPGYIACHTCDIPSCVNPDHIYEGTHSTNVKDCRKRGPWIQPPDHPFGPHCITKR